MYKAFYSLSKTPFSKDILSSDAFQSGEFNSAIGALNFLKQTKGIGMITGEPGAGKTFVLRSFKESLNPSLYYPIYFPLSTGGVLDFYKGIAYELGEEPRHQKVKVFRQVQQGIERMANERKIIPVIILDEMHLAKDAFLQDIALLFNFQMDSSSPFILILAGLPHLKTKIKLRQHLPLSQRIVAKYEFQPLDQAGVYAYINHHLKLAGAHAPIFSESALESIRLGSQGWPRMINKIALNALLFGAQRKAEQIDEEIVRLAIEESVLM